MPTNNPYSPQQIADIVREYYRNRNRPPTFAAPPKTDDERIDAMPNAHKLTKLERSIYKTLPGVQKVLDETNIFGTSLSAHLEKFNNSWGGKALGVLDVLAEGFERVGGTLEQIMHEGSKFDWSRENLRAAWYAGSLGWDTFNLPQWKRDKNGKIIGLTVPEDLPGAEGLAQARVRIKRLIEQGMDPKEALAIARDEYYSGLGALALRAQLNDIYGHTLGDPLNFITAAFKPVEMLQARRLTALTGKLAGGAEELLTKADEVGRLVKGAANADEAFKLADEALQLSSMAGDTKRAAQYATEAAEIARKAGRVEEAARMEQQAARFASMTAEEAAQFSEEALRAVGKKQLTLVDKAAILLTGGDPFRPTKFGKAIGKIPVLKAFQLTPDSKARELLNLVSDNISANVISRLINSPNAEAEFVSYIRRVAKGATGVEYGHAMITLEGRTVQAFVKGAESGIERLYATYQALGKEREMLAFVSDALGEAPSKLLRLMDESPEVLMDMLLKKAGENPAIAALVQSGELTTDNLRSLSKTIGNMPYNREMFFAAAMDAIETQAMRQAVVQFGVQAKGLLTRWSDAIKAAESLAFLRISPAYPMRNMINNEVTMLARGMFGVMPDSSIKKFWDDFGVVPRRLQEAITPAQEVATEGLSEAEKILEEAIRGGNYGTPEKVREFFQKLNLGKADMAKLGQKHESWASRRAFTLGAQQYLRKYHKPTSIREYISARVLDEIENISPEFARHFDNAVRASGAVERKFDELVGSNMRVNVDSILDDVSQQMGANVRDVLGDELVEHIHQQLPEALKNGTLESFKVQTRQMIDQHIEDWFNKQLENVVEHTKAQFIAGGANVWQKKLGEAQDIFWGAHIEHAMRMPQATELARQASAAGDWKTARALWRSEQMDAARYYDRAFRRVDAYIKGLEEGAAELGKRGASLPFAEVRATFQQWQDGWRNFFTEKNRLMDEFWDAFDANRQPTRSFDDVQRQIQSMYDAMVEQEDALTQRIDDLIASTIQDPAARQAYMNARDTLAELRKADKRAVNEMYRRVADLPVEERQAAWNQFWQQRAQRYQEARSVEQASIAIQQGDPEAAMLFSQARTAGPQATGEGFDIYKLAEEYGIPATTTSGARNDRRILNTINKYATRKVDLTGKATEVPRHELPEAVSKNMENWAKQLKRDLAEGEAGKRLRGADIEGGAEVKKTVRVGSTNPDWYKELYEQGLRKPAIDKALEKIIQDNGLDKGKTVERVKQVILEKITWGDKDHGVPPDLYSLMEMGASRKQLQASLDEWNDITKQDLPLEEALLQSMPDELRAQARYDDAGNLILPGMPYKNLADVPEDVARQAFEARAAEKGLPQPQPKVTPDFIAEVNKVIPDPPPLDLALDQLMYGRGYAALDAVVDGAKAAAQEAPTLLSDLPAHLQDEVRKAIRLAKNDMASTRYRAMKFGEWRRDSALLNYNRRTNFDNWLGHIAPFVFWTTHSMFIWAVESIDRPAMLTNYLRVKRFMEANGLEREGMPTRTKGKFRVELPFAPEWMGEQFVDPLRVMLPFDNWLSPFEQVKKQSESIEGRTERLLAQMLKEGEITQEEYDEAISTHEGSVWEFARTKTAGNDNSDNYDAWDFATTLAAPHAPIMWAYNAAFGDKEDIGPFTPMSRLIRNAATLMGVEDWNNSKWNIEAKIRRQLGLPAYDKWDDYRIDRALSNLAGTGEYTAEEVQEALAVSTLVQQGKLDPEEAKEISEVYREGVKRANQEYAGGWGAFAVNLLGIPVTSVPEGELELRKLADDFDRAYSNYKEANDSLQAFLDEHPELDEEEAEQIWAKQNPRLAEAADDLREFFDKYPEYETRLGLFDPPEERFKKFMIDQVWATYNQMPQLNKNELREQLPGFEEAFLNKNTRNYDEVPVELMQVWMKLMGTDPLGGLTAEQRLLVNLYGKMQLTDPETANRVQVFYDFRNRNFDGWRELQEEYYKLPKGNQRKAFLAKHPELKQYWEFRNNFMRQNPDLVPYLTDNQEAIERAKNQARTQAAVPTAQELRQIVARLPGDVRELVFDYASTGEPLPPVVVDELEYIAAQQGLDPQQFVNILGGGLYGVR